MAAATRVVDIGLVLRLMLFRSRDGVRDDYNDALAGRFRDGTNGYVRMISEYGLVTLATIDSLMGDECCFHHMNG